MILASKALDNPGRSPAEVIRRFGGRYSAELDIDLSATDAGEVFKWFLAAVLFAARISGKLAARTYRAFAQEDLVTPQKILARGWDSLVAVLDEVLQQLELFRRELQRLPIPHDFQTAEEIQLKLGHCRTTADS